MVTKLKITVKKVAKIMEKMVKISAVKMVMLQQTQILTLV